MNGQTVNVLIGNSEETYTLAIRLIIENVSWPTAQCAFTVVERLDDLLAQAERNRFDLAILILNNLQAPSAAGLNRIESTIATIGDLKVRCPVPVIAVSGYPDGPDFPARVREAGADEFLLLPLDGRAFADALSRCLRGVAGQLPRHGPG